jgi:hypothetical protein
MDHDSLSFEKRAQEQNRAIQSKQHFVER